MDTLQESTPRRIPGGSLLPEATPRVPEKTGVLLVNLGTPDAPETGPVRRYLREFLGDARVLTLPAPIRWALLNLIILPFRSPKSAAAYRTIWTDEGSPLLVHSRALEKAVRERLDEHHLVELAMRYGQPSIRAGIDALKAAGAEKLLVLPLFPQYASAVTASVAAEVFDCLGGETDIIPVEVLGPFFDRPGFAESWAAAVGPGLQAFGPDHTIFSFHGLPENQIKVSDPQRGHCLASPDCCAKPGPSLRTCYRAQCYATSRSLIDALGLRESDTSTAFQSRLGNTPWIQPYTDQILADLHDKGIRRLAVLCPAFVADCLETVEEIGIRLREDWQKLGGEDLWLAPCPNAHPRFADAVADWVQRGGAD